MGYVLLPGCSHKRVSMYHMAPKISQLPESARNRPGTADTVYACGLVSWATWAESGEEPFSPKTFFILGLAIFNIRDGLPVSTNASPCTTWHQKYHNSLNRHAIDLGRQTQYMHVVWCPGPRGQSLGKKHSRPKRFIY